MTSQKRNAYLAQNRLKEMEAPNRMLQDSANHNKKKAAENKNFAIKMNLKATSMETQLKPLENQLKLAEKEILHMRQVNKLL